MPYPKLGYSGRLPTFGALHTENPPAVPPVLASFGNQITDADACDPTTPHQQAMTVMKRKRIDVIFLTINGLRSIARECVSTTRRESTIATSGEAMTSVVLPDVRVRPVVELAGDRQARVLEHEPDLAAHLAVAR